MMLVQVVFQLLLACAAAVPRHVWRHQEQMLLMLPVPLPAAPALPSPGCCQGAALLLAATASLPQGYSRCCRWGRHPLATAGTLMVGCCCSQQPGPWQLAV